jgi:hypothetical protein
MGIKTSIRPESRVLVVLAIIISGLAGLGDAGSGAGAGAGAGVGEGFSEVQATTTETSPTSITITNNALIILLLYCGFIDFFLPPYNDSFEYFQNGLIAFWLSSENC